MKLFGHRRWMRSQLLHRLARNERGIAALEFALIVGALVLAMLNSLDLARYYYQRMEVENVTQMAAQAAWQTCDATKLPATVNCPGLTSAISAAITSSSLGSAVTLQTGSPSEGYYCVNTAGSLQYVSDTSSKPANCSAVGSASDQAGDYIQIMTQYSYKPLFPGIGIGSLLPTSIKSTSLMRLK